MLFGKSLKSEKYVPEFHIFFIVLKPKPREVWAASFKDRIVHHLLFNRIKFIDFYLLKILNMLHHYLY
jgi:hypothetical protein